MELKRPQLHEIPLPIVFERGKVYLTMSKDQWDMILKVGYERGFTLLEVDDEERVVKVYKMQPAQ